MTIALSNQYNSIMKEKSSMLLANKMLTRKSNYLFIFVCLISLPSYSAFIKTPKGCYDLRLLGGIVDVNACSSTAIQVTTLDCQTRKRLKIQKIQAPLIKCQNHQVQGQLKIKSDVIKFNAITAKIYGQERWVISQNGNSKKFISRTALPPKRKHPQNLKPSTTPNQEVLKKIKKLSINRIPFKLKFYFDASYAYNLNAPSVNNTSSTFADEQNALRMNDRFHNQFLIGLVNVGGVHRGKNYSLNVDLSYGPTYDTLMSSPDGSFSEATNPFRQTYFKYHLTKNLPSYIKIGKFKSPLMHASHLPGKNPLFSFDLINTLAVPHIHTGISWVRKWGPQFSSEIFLVNGWNQDRDNNSSPSLGLQSIYSLAPNRLMGIDIYFGPETNSDNGSHRLLLQAFQEWQWRSFLHKFQFIYGTSKRESINGQIISTDWLGASETLTYLFNKKNQISLRLEGLKHTNGFLAGTTAIADTVFSGALAYKMKWRARIHSFAEARFDYSNDTLFRKGSNKSVNTQPTFLFGAAINI
ncbi:MAG: hypothetical protein D6797_03795 [Bdellovibrio sp.]|nr:MAG: hypothetical protein D6797_03795 [Bdellovibrio sp.]